MSDVTQCTDRYAECPARFTTLQVGSEHEYTHTITYDRTITFNAGSSSIQIQKRTRDFSFTSDTYSRNRGCVNLMRNDFNVSSCGCVGDSHDVPKFKDAYKTVDSEIAYLDLRNDTIVIKEITDSLDTTTLKNTAQTETIDAFTGYDSQKFYPYVFESGIPIAEAVKYKVIINGAITELHTENVARSYPFAYVLMPTYPTSNFGDALIITPWAAEIEWYRQDRRKGDGAGQDGDAYLFWPDWGQSCGKLAQALDGYNRDLINHLTTALPLSGVESAAEVPTNKTFRGSVAFDRDKNMFYSVGVPSHEYAVDPAYVLNQKLLIDGTEISVPAEKDTEADVWFPIAPL